MSPVEVDSFFEDVDLKASLALDFAQGLITEAEEMSEPIDAWFNDLRESLLAPRISKVLSEALDQMAKAEVSYPEQVETLRLRIEAL